MFHLFGPFAPHVSVQIGDGRLLLKDSACKYDGLFVDAFGGDAVPSHLLTVEAMNVYLKHLKPRGLLAFNITNAYLDLAPVIGNVARCCKLSGCELIYNRNVKYIVLSPDRSVSNAFVDFARRHGSEFSETTVADIPMRRDLRVWTDDYSNLLSILKWR